MKASPINHHMFFLLAWSSQTPPHRDRPDTHGQYGLQRPADNQTLRLAGRPAPLRHGLGAAHA
ncbi:3-deoxy-manno-octulosonate cytidylyltransferase [Labeo rohita]|uniref:3-deoxy-manno-octulosonate cytidylyltransferase n=1 Tax=Labeo rohita TaxID=84645 RepID=A0ABQ8LWF5_LABRO|nr:3-deoxy-manno-octulosonate cytidylyltransferase [Labeo rohita]